MKFLDWLLGKVWDKPQAKEAPAPKSQSRAELARYLEPGLIALFGPEPKRKLKNQPKEEIVKLESFREYQIPKWTHAGKKGKTIHCPVCLTPTHVHHFAWSALVCSSCSKKSKKYEWLLVFNSK